MSAGDIEADYEAGQATELSQKALARINYLLGRGADAGRMTSEAASMIAAWATTLSAEEMNETLALVRDSLAEGIETAELQGDEIEPGQKAARANHDKALSALQAARNAFTRAAERMP